MAITDLLKRIMPPAPARKIGRFDQPDFGLNNTAGTQGLPIPIDRAVRVLSAMPPAPAPMIGAPSEAQRAQPDMTASAAPPAVIGAPVGGMPPAPAPQIGPAQQRLQGMASQGVPQLHGVKKVLDIAAQALVPTVEQAIPGTPGNYLRNLNVAHTQAMDEQAIEDQNLQRENIQSQISDRTAQQREREKAANAPEKTEKPITVESNGQAYERQTDGSWKAIGTPKPEPTKRYERATIEDPAKAGSPKDVLFDPTAEAGSNFIDPDTKAVIKGARPYVKPEAPEKPSHTLMLIPQPDGSSKSVDVVPGMTVPAGAHTIAQEGQINQMEQTRADLAENVNENLNRLDAIVAKRGDLFGKFAGRTTKAREWIGTNDPDIATMKQIEDNLGRAMTGAHGMRNGQLVEKAANDILNSYKNGPEAVRSAIQSARDSIKTFTADVESKGGTTGATAANRGTQTGTVNMRAPNGQVSPVPQNQVEHYKSLGAKVVQ